MRQWPIRRVSARPLPALRAVAVLLGLLGWAGPARGAWFDANWPFRRAVDVKTDPLGDGSETVLAEVLTAGRHQPDGADVRVASDEGRLLPMRLIGVGPGDHVRVAFAPVRGQRHYYVYFGNANPGKRAEELSVQAGLLLEMKQWPGGAINSGDQLVAAYARARQAIGNTLIPSLFTGKNPFGDHGQFVSRISGALHVPADGEYTFAVSAKDRGLLVLDGRPLVFCPQLTGHARFTGTARLKKGRVPLAFYHVNLGGDGLISVAWKKPGAAGFDVIPRDAFGHLVVAAPGALEENRKTLTADFKVEYMGESFYANHYSHRYRFTANVPRTQPPKYEWDFGDGQTAEGNTAEHVYLADGLYPVKVTARIASNADSQTTRLAVARDFRADMPRLDEPAVQSKIVEGYKLETLPATHLPWAVFLHERAKKLNPMYLAALRLAAQPRGFDPVAGTYALQEATKAALDAGRIEPMLEVWGRIPADSAMQPGAARIYAQLLVWRAGDFEKACSVLAPLDKTRDRNLQRLYAHALLLNQKADQAAKILEALPNEGPADRKAAISGAMARTVEYYIDQKEAEAGEEAWDRWQQRYPAEFMEGYSVLLRVRLIEVRNMPLAGARVAEAFAKAVPRSTYAPSLLDKASQMLAKIDPGKSAQLRKLLKEKYPEDPLSQDKR